MTLFDSNERLEDNRRRFRRRALLLAGVAAVAGYSIRSWWKRQPRPVINRRVAYVTRNSDFYQVSYRPGYWAVSEFDWKLSTQGPRAERKWSLEQIRELPSRKIFRTLSCISNPVGGTAIGNAQWTVTELSHVLSPILRPSERKEDWTVVFRGADGFHSAVPLRDALAPETVLAYEMNGEPLPDAHGYPLRVLLPNRYGMKQPRWLAGIEVQSGGHWGYWERRGWSDSARVHAMSRIDQARRMNDGTWQVFGIAWCGGGLVDSVELSEDGGKTWSRADFDSPLRAGAWATWVWNWKRKTTEETVLTVRVRDARGRVQEDSYSGTFPSGATGLHRVIV